MTHAIGHSRPNILLISFDTMRADFLGAYGSSPSVTPNLDRFAKKAVRFRRAYGAVPFTPPSLWALLHSVHIYAHEYSTNLRVRYRGENSFVERLRAAGYHTVGFTGSSILNRGSGFAAGFDEYFDTWSEPCLHNETTLSRILEYAKKGLKSRSPYFLYVHFYDPHAEWGDAPKKFRVYPARRSAFSDKLDKFHFFDPTPTKVYLLQSEALLAYLGVDSVAGDHRHLSQLVIPSYRSEVAWSDDVFGRLTRALRKWGLLDDTVVIVTSDHGFSFGEHDQLLGYVFPLFDEATRVPLMVSAPSLSPRVVSQPVSLIDVGPTILDFAGVGTRHNDGVSFRELLEGHAPTGKPRPVYAESGTILRQQLKRFFPFDPLHRYAAGVENRHSMLVERHRKLIYMPSRLGEKFELFDLQLDPGERNDIYDANDPLDRRMVKQLLAMRESLAHRYGKPATVDPEMLKHLESLGYIEESPQQTPAAQAPR